MLVGIGIVGQCRVSPGPDCRLHCTNFCSRPKKSKDHRSYYDATAAVQAMDEVLNLLSHRERERERERLRERERERARERESVCV